MKSHPFFIPLFLLLGFAIPSQGAAPASNSAFLDQVKTQRKTINSGLKDTAAAVRLHFFWSSWCDYCSEAYEALDQLQKDPSLSGKFDIAGYCLDDEITKDAKKKIDQMPHLVHYKLDRAALTFPPGLSRFPLVILEDTKSKKLDAYTGFSKERYHYIKRAIQRSLHAGNDDDNQE